MLLVLLVLTGKVIKSISNIFNLGSGSTWPGHIALSLNKNFIRELIAKNSHLKIVLIAGTNGKTTTGKLIQTILEKDNKRVFQNAAGANLVNGIASSLLLHSNIEGKLNYDYAIFEVDENSLPLVLKEITPISLILLNLFRDQLDRYGEVNTIAQKWRKAIQQLSNETMLFLNADDPQIVALDPNYKARYFGLDDASLAQKNAQHAADSTYCPFCSNKLTYKETYYSHLGSWECTKCNHKRPALDASSASFYPLVGVYNRYNTHAAVLFAKRNNVSNETIEQSLKQFKPAFGRQEVIEIDGKKVQIFLAKNPTSFNESLRTVKELNGKNLLIILNDRIPDGRDVSWIWDVDFEDFVDSHGFTINVSGDRVFDMALRFKYAGISKAKIHTDLSEGIKTAIDQTPENEILYILPTYSAMLEIRKILTGRKLL